MGWCWSSANGIVGAICCKSCQDCGRRGSGLRCVDYMEKGKTMTGQSHRTFYCSMKFKFLKVDIPDQTIYNCHAAAPQPVSKVWIENNPGKLFHTDTNINERFMMLKNERNPSCEQNCWSAEDHGAISPRIKMMDKQGTSISHTDPHVLPEEIDLTLDKNCNLTCSYCCSENSSAWARDLRDNGEYVLLNTKYEDNRYALTPKQQLRELVSKSKLKNTKFYQVWLEEFKRISSNLKRLTITGGEPLLNNDVLDLLKNLSDDVEVKIYTGLGKVSDRRLLYFLEAIKNSNSTLYISCENVGKLFEFNRYGHLWKDFVRQFDIIKQSGINFEFQNTISNLTIHGINEFLDYFGDYKIVPLAVYTPRFMAPYVLDDSTKDSIRKQSYSMPVEYQKFILPSIEAEPSESDRKNISMFLHEFVRRRSELSLDIYPKTFLSWIAS